MRAATFRTRLEGIRRRKRVRDDVNGVSYDSTIEAKRAGELRLLKAVGQITGLRVHPRFQFVVNGVKIGVYIADFDYREQPGDRYVVEDVKPIGRRDDPIYQIKRRLMLACFGINVLEVNR